MTSELLADPEIPLTARLDRDPLTVPREELLLSMLQIIELTENDQLKIVRDRLESPRGWIDAETKSRRWRMRNQMGDQVRWYQEPGREQPGGE
jgi:hypothetical protein